MSTIKVETVRGTAHSTQLDRTVQKVHITISSLLQFTVWKQHYLVHVQAIEAEIPFL